MEQNDNYIAPVMYIQPVGESNVLYKMLMIDWRCDVDGLHTFFNAHYYKLNGGPNGYAGFNSGQRHRLLFSIWDALGVHPEIEYTSPWADMSDLIFTNEGHGKHIKTEFDWQVGSWYTMCINAKTRCGKTFYSQWIRKQGDSNWLLCGIFSLPFVDKMFKSSSMFLEPRNNDERKYSVKNYFGRRTSNSTWKSWDQYIITNRYNIPSGGSISNQSLDCEYGVNNTDIESVWVRSGGEPVDQHISHGQQYPTNNPPISITQDSSPYHIPTDAPLVPRYILAKHSNKYLSPNSNDQVIQHESKYHWALEDSGDGYYYIMNKDKSKALTVGTDGLSVFMSTASGNDAQKWTKRSYVDSTSVYISPKNFPSKCIGVSNSSTSSGALIMLKDYDTTVPDIELKLQNTGSFKTIKNAFSSMYAAPSGARIIQRALAYRWIFIPVDDEYYYIVTQDCLKAISISGTCSGDNLSFASFVVGNSNQMWKIMNAADNSFYIIPKNASTMGIDIEDQSVSSGADLQIETLNNSMSCFRWILIDV